MNYNGLLDINLLEDYLDGKLDEKTMHQVEKLSLEDPFVAEALAGLSQSALRSQSLSFLQKRLHDRVAQKPIERKRWAITAQRLSIASAAAVLFIVVSVLFWMKGNNLKKMEANQAKIVQTEIAPQTTVEAKITTPVQADVVINKALVQTKTTTYASNKKLKTTVKPSVAAAPMADISPVVMQETEKDMGMSVKASGRLSKEIIAKSEPLSGWVKFEEYILLNNKLIKDKQLLGKSVQLIFNVDDKNRPFAIKILSGLTSAENEEAIRLLKAGPDWKYMPNVKDLAVVEIKF